MPPQSASGSTRKGNRSVCGPPDSAEALSSGPLAVRTTGHGWAEAGGQRTPLRAWARPFGVCVQRGVWIHTPRGEEMPERVPRSTAWTSTPRPEAGPRGLGGHAESKEPHDHRRLSGAASRGAQGGARTRQPGWSPAGCPGAERCRDGVTTRPLRGRAD